MTPDDIIKQWAVYFRALLSMSPLQGITHEEVDRKGREINNNESCGIDVAIEALIKTPWQIGRVSTDQNR